MASLLGLGLASGLPNVLTGDTLKAWLADQHIDVKQIGLFSLVVFPYTLKFLWAPLLDRYLPPILGRRRGWLLLTQLGVILGIVAIAVTGPSSADDALLPLAIAGTLLVFFSASQDIVADAYRADALTPKDMGAGAAVFVMGYRLGMILAGTGALMLAGRLGWRTTFLVLAGTMVLGLLATLLAPEPQRPSGAPTTLFDAVIQPLRAFWSAHATIALLILCFMFVFRLPDVMGNAMTMPLLRQKLEFTLEQIGSIRQFIGFFVTIGGALIGGLLVARLGLTRSLWIFGILQALSNLGFWWLTRVGNSPEIIADVPWFNHSTWTINHGLTWLLVVITLESFCGGLVAAGFVAYLMSQCDRRYSASQYAIFSAIVAAPGFLLAPAAGYLVKAWDYGPYFLFTVALGVPGMAMLPWIARTIPMPTPDEFTAAPTSP